MSNTKKRVTWNSWTASYLQALLVGDEWAATEVVDRVLEKGASMLDFYLKLFTPALQRVGELWSAGDISVADERLATEITMTIMDRLRLAMKRPRRLSDRILISCVEGERHYVGARMVADLFQMEGWQVDFLGPDVPTRALATMVLQRRPRLVGLSVTLPQNKLPIGDVINEVARLKAPPVVLLGGQSASVNDNWKRWNLTIKVAPSALVGLKIARQLLRPENPRALLEGYLKQLGLIVRRLRNEAGWTQQQLAKATGLTRAYVVGVEGGKQNVTMDVVIRLANALGITPDRFFETTNEES